MINEKITNKNKKYTINSIFKDSKNSEEFTEDDYSPLKILARISKLEELRDIDKITKYKDKVINTDNRPSFNFLREDTKCLKNEYIPNTNYGYKNRKKKFSTLFKKSINLNLFTENIKKKIKTENNFPSNFEEINDQIELKEMENMSSMDRYQLNNNTNILNQEELKSDSNYMKSTRISTSKYQRSSYDKNSYKPNANYIGRKMEKTRLIKTARKANINYKNLINLKLSNKKVNSRNIIVNNLSNNTKSFTSFSNNNTFNRTNRNDLNRDKLFITRNNGNFYNHECKTSRAGIKISKKLINEIINNGFIIDKYIKTKKTDKSTLSRSSNLNNTKNPFTLKTTKGDSINIATLKINATYFLREYLIPIWFKKDAFIKFATSGKWRIDKTCDFTDTKGMPTSNTLGFN